MHCNFSCSAEVIDTVDQDRMVSVFHLIPSVVVNCEVCPGFQFLSVEVHNRNRTDRFCACLNRQLIHCDLFIIDIQRFNGEIDRLGTCIVALAVGFDDDLRCFLLICSCRMIRISYCICFSRVLIGDCVICLWP